MSMKKSKTAKMIDLLNTIYLVNKVLLDLHDLPILERVNKEIEKTLKEIEK